MAYNKIMVVVTPEQAEEIIRYGFAYDDAIYREAIEKLQADKPDSDVLATLIEDIEDNIDIRASKYEMAKTYQARAQTIPATADDDLTAAAEQYKQEYEAWSNMHEGSEELANASDASDAESIDPNDSFDNLLASLQGFEQGDDPQWRHVVRSVNEQIDIRKGKNYENEDWNTLVQTLWETVKTKILVDRTLNKEWQAVMKKGGQEKDEQLREEIKRVYTAEAVIQAGATKVDKPTKAEKELGSQAHADRIARIAKQAQETFDDYVRKKLKINSLSEK